MYTNEIKEVFDLSQTKLNKFIELDLIKPRKDTYGDLIFNNEDCRLLQIINQLQKYKITLNDISLILNKEYKITDFILDKSIINRNEKEIFLLQKNIKRRKAAFEYLFVPDTSKSEIYLCFNNDQVIINDYYDIENQTTILDYEDIKNLKFSICTRVYSNHITGKDKPTIGTEDQYLQNHIGLISSYFIDLDIITANNIYQFESISIKKMHDIMLLIKEKPIQIIDPLNLISFFIENTDKHKLQDILKTNVRKWSKKYDIDNPRSIDVLYQAQQVKKDLRTDNFNSTGKIRFTKNGIYIPEKIKISNFAIFCYFLFILLLCVLKFIEEYL